MDLIEGIKTRRSIRAFEDKEVSKEMIEDIVSVATYAPSWKNSQSTRYFVVTDKEKKEKVANECIMGHEGNKKNIDGAPMLVVVATVNKRAGYERDGSLSTTKGTHWQSFDAGIATQTFCLAAHEKGLGTVIMGIYDEAEVVRVLGIPEEMSVSALIAIGYPAINPEAPKRKEVEQLVNYI